MTPASLDEAISASHDATNMILRGSSDGFKELYSRDADITLGNPFGGFGRGRDAVEEQLDRAASYFSDGEATGFENISTFAAPELGYTVEIERAKTKLAGSGEASEFAVRVTSIYRREDNGWRLVHRHADPRVARQVAESVLET